MSQIFKINIAMKTQRRRGCNVISTTSSAENDVTSTTSSYGSVLDDDVDAMLVFLDIRKYGYVWKFSTHSVTPPKTENNDGDRTFLESHALTCSDCLIFWTLPYGGVQKVRTRKMTSLRRPCSCNTVVTSVEVQDTDFLDTSILLVPFLH